MRILDKESQAVLSFSMMCSALAQRVAFSAATTMDWIEPTTVDITKMLVWNAHQVQLFSSGYNNSSSSYLADTGPMPSPLKVL